MRDSFLLPFRLIRLRVIKRLHRLLAFNYTTARMSKCRQRTTTVHTPVEVVPFGGHFEMGYAVACTSILLTGSIACEQFIRRADSARQVHHFWQAHQPQLVAQGAPVFEIYTKLRGATQRSIA